MYRITVLYPPPHDEAAFRRYYEETHLPLAAKLPGLRASAHAFNVEGVGTTSPYFCVWHGDFDNQEAMGKAMGSPEGQAVAADVPNYATGGAIVLHYALSTGPQGMG
jgi:uncharacterized protein (TIGR02118 family)